jgi:uncharacterized protein YggE
VARSIAILLTSIACGAITVGARGETPVLQPPTVTAQGTGTAEKFAEALRVEVQVLARGETYEAAVAALNSRVAVTRRQLREMGASEAEITQGIPRPVGPRRAPDLSGLPFALTPPPGIVQSEPLAPMPAEASGASLPPPLRGRVETKGKKRPAALHSAAITRPATVPPVAAVAVVAEIPLGAGSPETQAVRAEQLLRKIKAADLAGVKSLGVRAQDLDIPGCEPCRQEPGEPSVVFVGRFTPAERQRAASEAFRQARDEAAVLAGASGHGLATLGRLSAEAKLGADSGPSPTRQAPHAHRADEAVSTRPDKVTYQVTVTATFTLSGTAVGAR